MNTYITYEFPLNENIRIFIRLEHLFLQLDYFAKRPNIFDKRATITVFLEIMAIFSHGDLKSKLLTTLDAHRQVLSKITSNQVNDVGTLKVDKILIDLSDISKKLYQARGKIGVHMLKNDLFKSILQRSSIPGGTCSFDLPAFHYWLEQDSDYQAETLLHWTKPFANTRQAINLILTLIRQSNTSTQEVAESGFFQLDMDTIRYYQLLIISLEKSLPCFTEISGGKHRFTIRFMKPASDYHCPSQIFQNIPFLLTQCSL